MRELFKSDKLKKFLTEVSDSVKNPKPRAERTPASEPEEEIDEKDKTIFVGGKAYAPSEVTLGDSGYKPKSSPKFNKLKSKLQGK